MNVLAASACTQALAALASRATRTSPCYRRTREPASHRGRGHRRIAARSADTRRRTWSASARPPQPARPAGISGARTSRTASPRAAPTRSCYLRAAERPQRGDRLGLQRHALGPPAARALPVDPQAGRAARPAAWRSSPAACPRCATASPRAAPAWSCRCSAATWWRWPPPSRSRTTCSTAPLVLGVCDKIVPGLLIGALSFGQLPTVLVPAGPMPSGLPNAEKSRRSASCTPRGEVGRDELLEAESRSYHSPGTCTFYGTANSNQLVVEAMGLHLPGSSFVNPGTPLRQALTGAAGRVATHGRAPIGEIVDERALVNGVVALLATGGSTNHTMHLVAVAAAAGHAAHLGRLRRPLRRRRRCSPACTPTARPTSTTSTPPAASPFLIGELLDAGLHAPRRADRGGARPRALPRRAVPRRGRRAALAPAPRERATPRASCAGARGRSPPTAASACSTAASAAP